MAILQWGMILYLGALLVHAILWRLHRPQAPLKILLMVFFGVTAAGLAALYWHEETLRALGFAVLPNWAAYVHVFAFATAMGLAYIVGYTLLEWDSPTLTLVTKIARAGDSGVQESDLIEKLVERPSFVGSRMLTLMRSGVLAEQDGRYVLSRGNHFFYRFILFYGRLMRMDGTSG
jgi:hypothetical protein